LKITTSTKWFYFIPSIGEDEPGSESKYTEDDKEKQDDFSEIHIPHLVKDCTESKEYRKYHETDKK
jgi:hypothetical protein